MIRSAITSGAGIDKPSNNFPVAASAPLINRFVIGICFAQDIAGHFIAGFINFCRNGSWPHGDDFYSKSCPISTFSHFKSFINFKLVSIAMCGLHFQIHQKLNHDILGWLNKPKIPGYGGFPLANLHSVESLYFVLPQSQKTPKLFKVSSSYPHNLKTKKPE